MTSPAVSRIGAVLLAGLCGAVAIDLYLVVTQAWIFRNATPVLVSQWDASNALGRAAFSGGWQSALLGLVMHCTVSIVWAAIFTALFGSTAFLRRQPLLLGILFGTAVMLVMRYLVVPLGHAIEPRSDALRLLNLWIAHTLGFGIPVAFTVRAALTSLPAVPRQGDPIAAAAGRARTRPR